MDTTVPTLLTPTLQRARTAGEYRTVKAAMEWDLIDPIIIESGDDLKSKPSWQGLVEPYQHQVGNLITFCRRLPVTLLADDVGLGKTISAGLIVSELVARSRLRKFLVVCPKLLGPQWQEELNAKFGIQSLVVTGQKLIEADPVGVGAVITTYASARLYLDAIPKDRFEMLILDEAHKLRNLYGTSKAPQVAVCFRNALQERRFPFVLMLTATPIHNRLWDLYSLVDLLTVARGHQNPFGTDGAFARKFIADNRDEARVLNPSVRDEFRSIVYAYMSRMRRADARLYFPERAIHLHRTPPTPAEKQLISLISKPIQKLNPLAQISILQALTSSPQALLAQLKNMARNGTVPPELRDSVEGVVTGMPDSAKLVGLGVLIDELKHADPAQWRVVVFTGRRETQTTIQLFLEARGLKVRTISGKTGGRNQETLAMFRTNPPQCNVIVSTEAGSEGLNLQAANVLVNFDLPWNPMIVEQRIGRIQRLASNYRHVAIYNVILADTFEEHIVARLMQKLQLASHAIGDIESLLEAASPDDDPDDGLSGFEEQIRKLVIAALQGKDTDAATKLAEVSIENAKAELEVNRERLNAMLGGNPTTDRTSPQPPSLPPQTRSMSVRELTLAAFELQGAHISQADGETFFVQQPGDRRRICFDESSVTGPNTVLYAAGTRAFTALVKETVASPLHQVTMLGSNAEEVCLRSCASWASAFAGLMDEARVTGAQRAFEGTALVRARATVAHDSYERLVEIPWPPNRERVWISERTQVDALERISDIASIGVEAKPLTVLALQDQGIGEFCRFYTERRAEECAGAGSDERKRKKLEDEFTPRVAMSLVGLEGATQRALAYDVRYRFNGSSEYKSRLVVAGADGKIIEAPEMGMCSLSAGRVPVDALARCDVTGAYALKHLLVRSESSGRLVRPDQTAVCAVSGQHLASDEVETSAATGRPVLKSLLRRSAMSGAKAEASEMGTCEFTNAEVLKTELLTSQLSGKRFRADQLARSGLSDKVGHVDEFVDCSETGRRIGRLEAEQCWATGKYVCPGLLQSCEQTHKRVLPSELGECSVSHKRVLKRLLVESNISKRLVLEKLAVRSRGGKYCLPEEAKRCTWSGRVLHPTDIDFCNLTGVAADAAFIVEAYGGCLAPIPNLVTGLENPAEGTDYWGGLADAVQRALGKGNCKVVSAMSSPSSAVILACLEVRTLLGLRTSHAVALYEQDKRRVLGRVALGRRNPSGWALG